MSPSVPASRHFGERLQQALERTAIPSGRRRTTALANHYAIARETARLWLAGKAMPELGRLIEIADDCRVSLNWLATGRGPMLTSLAVGEEPSDYEVLTPEEQLVLRSVRKLSPKRVKSLLILLDSDS